jgi:Leucine-rich repeat (LRR) protein
LDLDNNQLKTLPQELLNVVDLKELFLATNPWNSFPESLYPLLEKLQFGQSDQVKKIVQTKTKS